MILYQLAINGMPFGQPMPEEEADKIISSSRSALSGMLGKVMIKPELKVVGGR